MDAIYNFAALTIVAASGHHANAGLPRISAPREKLQCTQYVGGLHFGLPFPSYDWLESNKIMIWNSRGWTFQEKILSKRLLLFTDCQVYFRCSNTVYCEDTAMETDRCSANLKKKWRPLRWAADRQMGENTKEVSVGLSSYIWAVETFTERVITQREDGVNAIQGVLGTLEAAMGTFYVGLPENYFGEALLWQPKLYAKARCLQITTAPFPSWSWARWELSDGCYWETNSLSSTRLESAIFLLTPSDLVKLRARDILDPWSGRPLRASRTTAGINPPRLRLSASIDRTLRKLGALLYFQTTIVKLMIGNQFPFNTHHTLIGEGNHYRIQKYMLTDRKGLCVGRIRMAASTRQNRASEIQEFITVCWSTGYKGPSIAERYIPEKQVAKTIEGGQKTYSTVKLEPFEFLMAKIMLVEWVDEVAQRVALGEIVSTAWAEHQNGCPWILFG
jgi:hypothetical protein